MPHPAPLDDGTGWLTSRQIARAKRAQENANLAVFRHALHTRAQSECACLDSQAIGDASSFALDVEMDVLDYGLEKAGQSSFKMELVAHRVKRLVAINDRRLSRRFG